MEKIPVIVVCGPTCSGKTAVGVELCKRLGGEVISADSMQIYKGLRISTAKPTEAEMQGIPHHLMDFLPPDASFSVADFARLAGQTARDIRSRGKLPVVVGGTGLYISSFVDGVDFSHTSSDPALREQLEKEAAELGAQAMHDRLRSLDEKAARDIHPNNVIRVIRAIEMNMLSGRTMEENRALSREIPSPYSACFIGLTCFDRAVLYDRINTRVDAMLAEGLVDEVRAVYERYDTRTAFNAIGYKELIP
ncbi:MAG: tRNA (adenosine(37)-N6)-dimethylallyltransferase MiaA, partial [Oscillospiraceae bacterium]|nr:tRNA (adenosine(37)-N6)-dimethylallyltransferase MiaA [Oscillospiraceae bacterium]